MNGITQTEKKLIESQNSRQVIKINNGYSNLNFFPHQVEATNKLNQFFHFDKKSKGLLVLPTGAGKTLITATWLLENIINNNQKVIWIAHSHELLDQAKFSFNNNCYSKYLPNRDQITINVISGAAYHCDLSQIDANDDIVIISKDSLSINSISEKYLKYNKDVFLVIDEAHRAVAKEYWNILSSIEKYVSNFKMIGLTATPFRTNKNEKSFLSKCFSDGIIYSKDINDLIIDGILAKPIFQNVSTNELFKLNVDYFEADLIYNDEYLELSDRVKTKMANRFLRNKLIVDTYDQKKHGKTIVFAINQAHAKELQKLFNEAGYSSEYIISESKKDLRSVTRKETIIERFCNDEFQILINVNMLTEGVDIPKVQSVFLTRPTNSKIMLTQMVGRALRGVKAGGTEFAYIVNFIDKWDGSNIYLDPKDAMSDEIDNTPRNSKGIKHGAQLINKVLLKQFDDHLKNAANNIDIETSYSTESTPIGWIDLGLIQAPSNSHKILVYDNQKNALTDFENMLQFQQRVASTYKDGEIVNRTLFAEQLYNQCFANVHAPKISTSDIGKIVDFYFDNKIFPPYYSFDENIDISGLAKEIYNKDLTQSKTREFIEGLWGTQDVKSIWQSRYEAYEYFNSEVFGELAKLNSIVSSN